MLKASEGGVLRAEAEGRSVLTSFPEGSVLPTGGRHQ